MDFSRYNTIIFDLGGVIIDIDPELTVNTIKSIAKDSINLSFNDELFLEYELGGITTAKFLEILSFRVKHHNKDLLASAWNKLLLEIPQERIDLIQKLAKKYNCILLSNTTELHINHINTYLGQNFRIDDLKQMFTNTYYSFELNLSKPDIRIYEHVIEDAKINPQKSIFVDDNLQNVIAAKEAGLHAYHLNLEEQNLNDLFNENKW